MLSVYDHRYRYICSHEKKLYQIKKEIISFIRKINIWEIFEKLTVKSNSS